MALNRSHSKEGGVVVPGGERCGDGGTGGTGGTGGRSRGAGGAAGRGPAALRRGQAPGERPSAAGAPSSGPGPVPGPPPRVPPRCPGFPGLPLLPRLLGPHGRAS